MLAMAGCGSQAADTQNTAAETTTDAAAETTDAAAETTADAAGESSDQKFTVGICQLVQHDALDAATQGFEDALKEKYGDNVTIDYQNAQGDSATCSTIVTGFVNNDYDLILANATPALQAAVAATTDIPILGTSVTDYGAALNLTDFTGTTGMNVSGTSDLAPLDQQEKMIVELVPDVKKVAILYCSAEANSVYQADVVKAALEDKGITVKVYTFADSNDVATVTATACDECDALYIPTDNTAASCAEAINNVALPKKTPIIAGEEGIAKGCGIATLSIDYYELGVTTGKMAAKILTGESDISSMPIEYYQNPVKKYNADICEQLGISVPSDYTAIG